MMKIKKFILKMVAVFVMVNPVYAGFLGTTVKLVDTLTFNFGKGLRIYQKDKSGNDTRIVDNWETLRLYADRLTKVAAIVLYIKSENLINAVCVLNNAENRGPGTVLLCHQVGGSLTGLKNDRLWTKGMAEPAMEVDMRILPSRDNSLVV